MVDLTANTTRTPRPPAAGAAATLTASTSCGPVRAGRGRGPDRAREHDRRVGVVQDVAEHRRLLERVRAVRDDHADARRLASRASRQICSWSAAVRCALGLFISVRAYQTVEVLPADVPATIAAASRSGWAPPVPVIPMVPPADRISTRRVGARRSGGMPEHLASAGSGHEKPRLSGAFLRCAEEDSNLHPVIPHKALNLARLPIPPSARGAAEYSPPA